MVELLGMQIGCCLVPIITWPINQSFPIKDGWTFLSKLANLQGVDLTSFRI